MGIFPDMNDRFHAGNVIGNMINAARRLALVAFLGIGAQVALAGPPKTTTYIGTDLWFGQMRAVPANSAMIRELAHTNFVVGVPADCVEVAGTITFPDGNPFPGPGLPELQIYCRDQSADAVARRIHLEDPAHFYTVFRRGQRYDFYWKLPTGRERFCSILVGQDAQTQHSLVISYPPPSASGQVEKPADEFDFAGRSRSVLAKEYDLSGFPAFPSSDQTKHIAEAMRVATTTEARAAAHEMLARYYDGKGDSVRAAGEHGKANSLRQGLINAPPDTVILK
jgi:hypothetical protein